MVGQGRLAGGKAQLHRGISRNDALLSLTDQLEHLAAPGGDSELVSRAVDRQADRTQHCFRRDGTRCQHHDVHTSALRTQHGGIVPQGLFQQSLNGQLLTVLIEQDAQHVLTLDVGGAAQRKGRDIEYDGRLYTRYEISQMQRARERAVRKWKRRYLAEDAAGADTTASAMKLRQARQSLADFTRATGGRVDSARTSVHGFGRSASSKATWAAKYSTENISIGRSVGAKAKNYVVVDKSTGEEYYFVAGTRTQNAQVFAGKGGVKPLHEEVAQGLAAEFGGKPEDWQHCKGKGWLDVDGESVKAEVHWFQNGSEKVKFKVKRWLYDED